MKLQTIKLTIITLIVVSFGQKLNAQTTDPFLTTAITLATASETSTIDQTTKSQDRITFFQGLINVNLGNIRKYQELTYDYLTNISGAVQNARDIKKSVDLSISIVKLCDELRLAIAANPQGGITMTVGTKQIVDLSDEAKSLYVYISGISLNKKVLLNSAERLLITGQVVHRLEKIHFKLFSLIYSVHALSFKDLPRLLVPDIYYSTLNKKRIAESIINRW
ncbi:hypothetical protein [Porphyromonas levii]|uniref:Uncharacterized protein n=1 Tax=Porphyromonas levii TaxID=28114 RepID=A0A4Y8WQN7_9PORP|nr:hypothetical protein [Porphyromonas levii]TFH94907.1 hypothetical protein E4P47_05785 [Porphyromonas levii]TFH96833.1 hypothetical protein E4P48_03600 [Porphyromonas levii]